VSNQLQALRKAVEAAKKVQDELKKAGEQSREQKAPFPPAEKGKAPPPTSTKT